MSRHIAFSDELNIFNRVDDRTMLSHQNVQYLLRSYALDQGIDGAIYDGNIADRQIFVATMPSNPSDDSIDDSIQNCLTTFATSTAASGSIVIARGRLQNFHQGRGQEITGISHWSCLHLQRIGNNITISHINSSDPEGRDAIPESLQRITAKANNLLRARNISFDFAPRGAESRRCQPQIDGYSCGYHACFNAIDSHLNRPKHPRGPLINRFKDLLKVHFGTNPRFTAPKTSKTPYSTAPKSKGLSGDFAIKDQQILLSTIASIASIEDINQRILTLSEICSENFHTIKGQKELERSIAIIFCDIAAELSSIKSQESKILCDIINSEDFLINFIGKNKSDSTRQALVENLLSVFDNLGNQSLHEKVIANILDILQSKTSAITTSSTRRRLPDTPTRKDTPTSSLTSTYDPATPPTSTRNIEATRPSLDSIPKIIHEIYHKKSPSAQEFSDAKKAINGYLFQSKTAKDFFEPESYCGLGIECDYRYNEKSQRYEFEVKEIYEKSLAQEMGIKAGAIIFSKKSDNSEKSLKEIITSIRNGINIGLLKENGEEEKINANPQFVYQKKVVTLQEIYQSNSVARVK